MPAKVGEKQKRNPKQKAGKNHVNNAQIMLTDSQIDLQSNFRKGRKSFIVWEKKTKGPNSLKFDLI